MLGGHDAPQGHSTQVLQTGHAARALPEVNAAVTGPGGDREERDSQV